MIDLSLDKLRLIAQSRNISNYANKFKEDLKKALNESEPKPKPKTKLKPEQKPKPELKIEIKVNGKKFKKLGKDFDELRHKFSKKEIKEYRKAFYDTKKYKLFGSEIDKTNKNLTKLRKVLNLKSFMAILIVLIMKILIIMINMILPMMINIVKLGVLGHYLKRLIEIITNQ